MASFNRGSVVDARNQPAVNMVGFDWGRFADPVTPESALNNFDQGRLGTTTPSAQGMQGLQRALMDQQLSYGILPALPTADVQPAPPIAAYAEPAMPARAAAFDAQIPAQGILSSADRQRQQQSAAKMTHDMTTRNVLGTLGGAILGGALLGPIGGLLGGYLGKTVGNNSYYPDAPQPIAGQEQKGSGYSDLSDYGRDVYSESGQFRDAVNSGRGGLW